MRTNSYFISNRINSNKDVVHYQEIPIAQGPPGLFPRKDLQGGLGGLGGPGGPGPRKYLLGSPGSPRGQQGPGPRKDLQGGPGVLGVP
jgi:hypothetical protein